MADSGMVEIMCRKAGSAEFGWKPAAKRLKAAAGQNQKRTRSRNALQIFTMPVAGQFSCLKDTCRAIRKSQHDHSAPAKFLACTIGVQIGSIHLPK